MDSILGPTGVDFYLAGLFPLIVAIVIVWLVRARLRADVLTCSNRAYGILVVLATILAVAAFSQIEYRQPLDVLWDYYFRRGLNLVHRGVFGYGDQPTAFFVPGYSAMIALFVYFVGPSGWAYFLPNICLLLLSSLSVRWWGRKMGLSLGAANVLSLVVLLYPTRFFSTFIPIPDVPFSLVYMGAFLCIPLFSLKPQTMGYVALAGVLGGISALVRPNGLLLLVPLIVGFLLVKSGRSRALRLATLSLSFVVVLVPWSVRNSLLFGKAVGISTNVGYNLSAGNNPTRVVHGGFYPDSLLKAKGKHEWNEAQRDSFWMNHAMAGMKEAPLAFITLGVQKVVRTFSTDTYSLGALRVHTNAGEIPQWLITATYGTNNFLYYSFAGVILLVLLRKWSSMDEVRWGFIATIVCVAATVFVMFGLPRLKEPLMAIGVIVIGTYFTTSYGGNRKDTR